jgi:carbon-monoxide dehydrogenase medium subunit
VNGGTALKMRPGPFIYQEPENLAQALRLIKHATIMAGGQSLIPSMRLRQVVVSKLLSIASISELSANIIEKEGCIEIGALATLSDLLSNQIIKESAPWLQEAAQQVGDIQVRNLATVVGNVCWSDPRANMSIALLASNASATIVDQQLREKIVSLKDFFVGFQRNCLQHELVTKIIIPCRKAVFGSYQEFSRQRNDLALVNVCAVSCDTDTKLAIGGTNNVPLVLEMDTSRGDNYVKDFLDQIPQHLNSFITDQYGSKQYRLELATTIAKRVLTALRSKKHE